jgi:HK97 family phage major capsid protein
VWKQAAWAFGAFETLEDSGDVAGELSVMFADAKNRLESQLFTTGTGSSQPQGIVTFASNTTSVVAGSSGDANAATMVAADIYAVRAALSPRWRGNASWVSNLSTAHTIRQLGTSSNYHAFSLDLTQSTNDLALLGRPFYECSDMDSTIVSGSTDFVLLHGDFQQFAVVDRVGMTMAYEPMIYSGGKLPTGESGWFVYWRSGSGGLVSDAFRLLKL